MSNGERGSHARGGAYQKTHSLTGIMPAAFSSSVTEVVVAMTLATCLCTAPETVLPPTSRSWSPAYEEQGAVG